MNINIQATGVELTDYLKKYINEKIGELDKFIKHPESEIKAWVNLSKNSNHHVHGDFFQVTVDLHLPGHSVRAETNTADVMVGITEAKDQLQQEIKKYKGKMKSKRLRGFQWFKNFKNKE